MLNNKVSEEIEELDSYTTMETPPKPPIKGEAGAPKETKANSIFIIFATWNTMVGTALTTLPWAFQ